MYIHVHVHVYTVHVKIFNPLASVLKTGHPLSVFSLYDSSVFVLFSHPHFG